MRGGRERNKEKGHNIMKMLGEERFGEGVKRRRR
jgi:hypothetical protein